MLFYLTSDLCDAHYDTYSYDKYVLYNHATVSTFNIKSELILQYVLGIVRTKEHKRAY